MVPQTPLAAIIYPSSRKVWNRPLRASSLADGDGQRIWPVAAMMQGILAVA